MMSLALLSAALLPAQQKPDISVDVDLVTVACSVTDHGVPVRGLKREDFELRDLRRTTETMLAALKVPSDVRAQLLSHGLGGVQNRHYDHHDYAVEKKQALERWSRHLTQLKERRKTDVIALSKSKSPRDA